MVRGTWYGAWYVVRQRFTRYVVRGTERFTWYVVRGTSGTEHLDQAAVVDFAKLGSRECCNLEPTLRYPVCW